MGYGARCDDSRHGGHKRPRSGRGRLAREHRDDRAPGGHDNAVRDRLRDRWVAAALAGALFPRGRDRLVPHCRRSHDRDADLAHHQVLPGTLALARRRQSTWLRLTARPPDPARLDRHRPDRLDRDGPRRPGSHQHGVPGHPRDDGAGWWLFAALAGLVAYTLALVSLVGFSSSLITLLPETVLGWIDATLMRGATQDFGRSLAGEASQRPGIGRMEPRNTIPTR